MTTRPAITGAATIAVEKLSMCLERAIAKPLFEQLSCIFLPFYYLKNTLGSERMAQKAPMRIVLSHINRHYSDVGCQV